MILRLLTLTQLLAAIGLVILIAVSAPVTQTASAIREATRRRGQSSLFAAGFVFAILAIQLLIAALERRDEGASPLTTLPRVGQVFVALSNGARLNLVLLAISAAAVLWSIVARAPSSLGRPAARLQLPLALWLSWLVVGAASTAVSGADVSATMATAYSATLLSILACLLCIPYLDSNAVNHLVLHLMVLTVIATLACMRLSYAWSWTVDWPGGFVDGPRLRGLFPQPNVAGSVYAMFGLIVLSRRDMRLVTRLALIVPTLWLLLITGSRGALVLFLAGVGAMYWASRPRRLLLLTALLLVASAAYPLLSDAALRGTLTSRADSWNAAITIARRAPIVGGGSFPLRLDPIASQALYAHNQFLQTWAESGIVGLCLLILAVSACAWRLAKADAPAATALLMGVVATFPFENPLRVFASEFAFPVLLMLVIVGIHAGRPRELHEESAESLGPGHATVLVPG